MSSMSLLNNYGSQIFTIITAIPVLFYIIWRRGYNLKKMKYALFSVLISSFILYFGFVDFLIIEDEPWTHSLEKTILFGLLSLSMVLTIIILTIPNNQLPQDVGDKQIQEMPKINAQSKEKDNNSTTSQSIVKEIKRIRNPVEISKEKTECVEKQDEFQKLLNDLFEEQQK